VEKRVAESIALGRAHRPVVEIEREIANLVLLGIDDLAECAMFSRRVDWQPRLRHVAKQRSQDLDRPQFDPGNRMWLPAGSRLNEATRHLLGLEMRDPNGPIDGADADRAVATGQNLARRALEALFLMRPIEEATLAKQSA
jgi:hypothetical protein